MDFPLHPLMDEQACYDKLLQALHPEGLGCPRCGSRDRLAHRRHRDPVLDYRCKACGRVFNAFTGTLLQGTPKRPSQVLLILRGIVQGVPTAQLAREMGLSRPHLLELRHRLQAQAAATLDRTPLPDAVTEADEMYQNAGEKRGPAPRPGRPAQTPSQQSPWPRHLEQRPATGTGRGRPRKRVHPSAGAAAEYPRRARTAGAA